MAAQLRIDSNSADEDNGDALALCLLHDLLGVAAFLASHPIHAAYILFFSRYLLPILAFFCPLLVSTSLLLVVLVTFAPYVGGGGGHGSPEWLGVRFLGRTCGIAVGVLCAELRPDASGAGRGGVGLVGQLCSFVVGPADVAAVLRVGKIMGELCDIGNSCFVLEENSLLPGTEKCNELAIEFPIESSGIEDKISLDQEDCDEIKDEIEEKNVVCEDLRGFKGPGSSPPSEHCCPSEASVQEMEEQEDGIQGQRLNLPDMDGVSDGVEEKRLECDPVSVEIKRCELVKSLSSVSRQIRQWEAQASGNFKRVLEDMEDNSVEFSLEKGLFKDVKEFVQSETDTCTQKCGKKLPSEEFASLAESVQQQQKQGFKDLKEYVKLETETPTEKCSEDLQVEESASIAQPEQELAEQNHKDVQPEPEPREQECKDVQPEQKLQEDDYNDVQYEQELQDHEHRDVLPEQELQDKEYKYADEESAVLCNGKENSLKSTSTGRRVHSRTSLENVVNRGSPRKEEWKRSLACKLYEERMLLKLCRDRAVVECSDNMDMLWEAYDVGGSDAKRGRDKATRANNQDEFVEESGQEEEEDDDEGSVRQLCCLQALKFSVPALLALPVTRQENTTSPDERFCDGGMGFPVGYSELLLPKQLLYLLLLLGYVRRFLLWAFDAVGLGDLLDLGDEQQAFQEHEGAHGREQQQALQHRRPEFRPVPAMVIEEVLPVVRFDDLVAAAPAVCGGGNCAVCLSGIGGGDEVRRLSNCRHVFHRGCLDRWMEHDQRTCPLCRAPLIPDEMASALWALAAGVPDASDFDYSYFGAPLTPVPTPTLLRPHELLLSGLGGYQ